MSKKFLVVDDSKIARTKIIGFLEDLNYEVIHEAIDGEIAVERFEKLEYDFVIMDLDMPNLTGDKAAEKMLYLNPNINIILVTSIVHKKALIDAMRIGVKKILNKPVSFDTFKQTINDLESKGQI